MPKPLLKTAAAHFAAENTERNKQIDGREARRIGTSSLRQALRERKVKSKLSKIYHRKLVSVWRGANFRLPSFVARLSELSNRHLPAYQHITLKTPPLLSDTTIVAYEDAIFAAIIAKLD